MKKIRKQNSKHPLSAIIIALNLLIVSTTVTEAQSARKITADVKLYMEALRTQEPQVGIQDLLNNEKSHKVLIKSLRTYCNDTLDKVKMEAYRLMYDIANRSRELSTRQIPVEQLTVGIQDNDRSISGWNARHLSNFNRNDFNEEARQNITKAIANRSTKLDELMKVAGYLKIEETKITIREIAATSSRTSDKLAAYLALARMGEESYAVKITALIRRQGLNDDVVYDLLPGLIYTRNKTCINYVIETLYEDKKHCISPDPDNPRDINCGYRIMEMLAPVIADYPFEVKASGDLKTNDYKKALETVREWFLSMGSNYRIIDNTY